ncbi:hypothetical protein [Bacillus sp. FJAT-26390]|uniref:hypothetical protein n=1 Tax=Bacillus sp. FJAT-26390 TaxID=1743142 RepID=UPI000807AAF5|nr:hypothetical protein [Bacillus sp. FJAT-26390]OBZ13329.1 hypothetical protein A7975_10755 [Bacillus sp. FJAT-26390]
MLLIEYEISTGKLLSASMGGVEFIELPETSASCIVEDAETAKVIWYSHVNGGSVIVFVDVVGKFLSADIDVVTPPLPEVPKTPDQLRIEQLEAENAMMALEVANTNIRLDQSEQAQADLMLTLVLEGVL